MSSLERSPKILTPEGIASFLQLELEKLNFDVKIIESSREKCLELVPAAQLDQTNKDIFATLNKLDPFHYAFQPFLGNWSIKIYPHENLTTQQLTALIKPFRPQNQESSNPSTLTSPKNQNLPHTEDSDIKIYPPPKLNEV